MWHSPKAKKSLSQNFLSDPAILGRIAEVSGLTRDESVLEIGPGPGALSEVLCERAGRVVAVELDRRMCEHLRVSMALRPNFELHEADIMKFDIASAMGSEFRVVSNIPYSITTPIIFRLIELRSMMRSMTLTVQKEVAERIAAHPGGADYGALSVMVQFYGRPRLAFRIPRGAFRPVPGVDSACLHIEMRQERRAPDSAPRMLRDVVREAFNHRRKTLRNSLIKMYPRIDEAFDSIGIDPGRRPQTLGFDEFAALAEELDRIGG